MKKVEKDKLEQTYGIFKFKVPDQQEITQALSLSGEPTAFKKLISFEMERFYENISPPEEGDWLMKRKEYGETYADYMRSGIIPTTESRDVIYLVPLSYGENIFIDQGFLTGLLFICESYFHGMKVKILDKKIDLMRRGVNKSGVSIKMHYESQKIQFNANEILGILKDEVPQNAFCMIAFTDQDLYVNWKEDAKFEDENKNEEAFQYNNTYSYGLTMLKKRIGVFSFARYDPLFYEKNSENNEEDAKHKEMVTKYFFVLFKRACKVIVKEITHMFGLKNCIYYKCIMNGFGSIEEFDSRPFELCPVCLRKLYSNILIKSDKIKNQRVSNPFIVFDRFVKLKETLQEHFPVIFENEIFWYDKRIEVLKEEI